jgi:TolB protein
MDRRRTLVVALAASLLAAGAFAAAAGAARIVYSHVGLYGLRTVEPDGTGARKLTKKKDWEPQWSPDRKQVLFDRCYSTAPSAEYDVCAMYVTAAAGGDAHVVRRDAGAGTWSPDGKRLAWDSGYRVYIGRADGSHAHRLWRGHHFGGDPAWSGPANRIAYTLYILDGPYIERAAVHIIKPDGYSDRLVTRDGYGADWSPDGGRLVYYREHSGLCIIRPDGTHRHCLHVGEPFDRPAAWSPDGRWIAYTSGTGCHAGYAIYKIRPDGTGRKRVACGSEPDW